jgi:hypothetical protein
MPLKSKILTKNTIYSLQLFQQLLLFNLLFISLLFLEVSSLSSASDPYNTYDSSNLPISSKAPSLTQNQISNSNSKTVSTSPSLITTLYYHYDETITTSASLSVSPSLTTSPSFSSYESMSPSLQISASPSQVAVVSDTTSTDYNQYYIENINTVQNLFIVLILSTGVLIIVSVSICLYFVYTWRTSYRRVSVY